MFYKQLSHSYGPISPKNASLIKCFCFDEKPAEITNSCEVPGYPAVKLLANFSCCATGQRSFRFNDFLESCLVPTK